MSLYLVISGAKPFIAFISGNSNMLYENSSFGFYFFDFITNGFQTSYELIIKISFFIPAIILLLIAILSFVIPNRKARIIVSIVLTIIATIIIFISAQDFTYLGNSLSNTYTFTCLGMIILSLVGINMFSAN